MSKVIRMDHISRDFVRQHPDWVFLFGDNLARSGYGGQAKEMRGEPNAVGIPTKHSPSMHPDAFFYDDQLPEVVCRISEAFTRIPEESTIVIPTAGLGMGLARLDRHAPKILAFIEDRIKQLNSSPVTDSAEGAARNSTKRES